LCFRIKPDSLSRDAIVWEQEKRPDYPEETEGGRWAAKLRKSASKPTPEEEAAHFRRGLSGIFCQDEIKTKLPA
jgi:hypothetical protein